MGIGKRQVILPPMAVASTMVLLFLSVGIAAGQGNLWGRLFGTSLSDKALAVAVDHLGNIYAVGSTAGRLMDQTRIGGDSDAYVLKFDSSGNSIWARQFGSVGTDVAWSVAVSSGGELFVAGQTAQVPPGLARVSGYATAFLRKLDSDGTELWFRQFGTPGGVRATGVAVDSAGNSYVVGQTEKALPGQTSFGSTDAFLRSYDPHGMERWTRQFGDDGGDFAHAVAADNLGNTFVVGSSSGEITLIGLGRQITISPFIRKFGADGTRLWERRLHINGFAEFLDVAVDSQGSIYVAGWASGAAPGQTQIGGTDAFVTKIDSGGRDIWTHQFGTQKEDRALGITVDGAGNSYAVGWTRGEFPNQAGLGERGLRERRDAFVRKLDPQGNALWTRQFGTRWPQRATSVVTGGAGSLFIVGNTTRSLFGQTALGTVDAFLLKLDGGRAGDPLEARAATEPQATSPLKSGSPAPATPSGALATAPPAPLNPARLPPDTPVSSPAIAPVQQVPSTSACSAPHPGSAPVSIGWLLLAMIPASLAGERWRRRRRRGPQPPRYTYPTPERDPDAVFNQD